MDKQPSRVEYTSRMHRVLHHIDRHLDQPLELALLAEVAHFSPYHFHRLFSAWMGETLGDYVRRRRIEMAAFRLAGQPLLTVTELALSSGFGSPEAFTRAFKQRFGVSPTVWREQRAGCRNTDSNPDQVDRNSDQAPPGMRREDVASHITQEEHSMDVKLIDRPQVTVAYMRYIGPYGPHVHTFWMQRFGPWMARHGLTGRAAYGISYDDPHITAPEQCRYDACVEVEPGFVADGGAQVGTIPGGRYAVLSYYGKPEQVGEAWTALLRIWLPDSGLQLDARPCFEHYPPNSAIDPATGHMHCEICIPVAPL